MLELYLKTCDGTKIERIVIEMNISEAKAFIAKLKEIEKVI